MDDDAVSPVMGVILMVAITVILAGLVFFLVENLVDTEETPFVSFEKDEQADLLRVVSAQPADWMEVQVTLSAPCQVALNGGPQVTASGPMAASSATVLVGDVVQVSRSDASQGTCDVSLGYVPTNRLVGSWSFSL